MSGTLRRDTALYASATLLDRLLGFLLLPLLTRTITPQDYGAWTQTAATAGMLLPLVLFALPTTIVRYFAGGAGATQRAFDRIGAVCAGLFMGTAALVLLGAAPIAAWTYGDPLSAPLLGPMLLLLAADTAVELAIAWLRAAGRMGAVTAVMMARSALRYGAILALVMPGPSALVDLLTRYGAVQVCFATLVLVFSRSRLASVTVADTASPSMAAMLRFSAPLVALAGFTTFNAVIDRFLLLRWLDLDSVAVYAAAQSLTTIPMIFYSVLGFTLFPVLARHWAEGRRAEAAQQMSRALRAYLFLCVPVAGALALIGPWALPLLTTTHYSAGFGVFGGLLASVAAYGVYQIVLYALLLDGRSLQVLVLAIVATALNALLNLLLAPLLGIAGAAAAAACSNVVMAMIGAYLVRRVLPWTFPWADLAAVTWRAILALLPLAALVLAVPQPALGWMAAGVAASAALYLALDLTLPGSMARGLLK